jgi:hypothetical protein
MDPVQIGCGYMIGSSGQEPSTRQVPAARSATAASGPQRDRRPPRRPRGAALEGRHPRRAARDRSRRHCARSAATAAPSPPAATTQPPSPGRDRRRRCRPMQPAGSRRPSPCRADHANRAPGRPPHQPCWFQHCDVPHRCKVPVPPGVPRGGSGCPCPVAQPGAASLRPCGRFLVKGGRCRDVGHRPPFPQEDQATSDRDGTVWCWPRHDHNGMALALDGPGAASAVLIGEGAFRTGRRGRLTGGPGTFLPGRVSQSSW